MRIIRNHEKKRLEEEKERSFRGMMEQEDKMEKFYRRDEEKEAKIKAEDEDRESIEAAEEGNPNFMAEKTVDEATEEKPKDFFEAVENKGENLPEPLV